MPEENTLTTDVKTALYSLEQYHLNKYGVRTQNYNTIQNVIDQDEYVSTEVLERLLAVCIHDMVTYSANAINMIAAIVSKVKTGIYNPAPDLLPSALAVINMIKTIASFAKVESLIVLSYKTLLCYPDDVLIAAAEHYDEVMELLNVYCHTNITISLRLEALNFLSKLLLTLPQEKRMMFVEKGIPVWFSKIIRIVIVDQTKGGSGSDKSLEILELLTDDLVNLEYSDHPEWHNVLECICNRKQYPAVMKNLLNADSDGWHRLWKIFIRLLKHQITQSLSSIGSPINSMLPVVEAAFKLDVKKRTKAFECWNVLIDSFSSKANENNINKTLKLLIIPLKSNNARSEETVLAKFKCWWHLLRKFQNKMDTFLDTVLVSFLHFCFGQGSLDKFVPGLISVNVKRQCNQGIVDIVGHVNCEGCTDLPQLNGKIINTKHLVDNWNHWIYSVISVIKTGNTDHGLTQQQMTCLWKSFILTIGELPENNIRKDLFAGLMSIINNFVQDHDSNILNITFNILIMSLFDEDPRIKQLFKSDMDLIIRIVKTILDPSLNVYYKSLMSRELVTKFKAITNLIFDEEICKTKQLVLGVLVTLPKNDIALLIWTAMAESLCESESDKCILITPNILLWPLRQMHLFTEVKTAAMTWYTTYDLMYPKLITTDIHNEILEVCFSASENHPPIVYFKLSVVLAVLKHKFNKNNTGIMCEKELKLLLDLTKAMSYKYFEAIFPLLVARIVDVMTIVTLHVNDIVAALILVSVKNVLHMLTQAHTNYSDESHIMGLIGDLLKPLNQIFTVESYAKLIPDLVYHLLKCFSLLAAQSLMKSTILSILKSILATIKSTDTNYKKIISLMNVIENNELKTDNEVIKAHPKDVRKKPVTKQAKIVKSTIENGEEYVVVNSNWKFNPRKLTENQKEKLQRKREDIPALYQDLSQSQDEFRLASWKTDSQDTSSSRSESKSNKSCNETVSEILSNLPSSNVVPRIIENVFSENDKSSNANHNTSKIQSSLSTSKDTKSPRMALKDRVFRNVRNLIESSGIHKENRTSSEDSNINNNKTPAHAKRNNLDIAINSAPPLLSADRPSRVKRKPKKFEDLLLLTPKKRRNSLQDINSNKTDNSDIIHSLDTNKDKTNMVQSSLHNESCSEVDNINIDKTNTVFNQSTSTAVSVSEKEEDTHSIVSTILTPIGCTQVVTPQTCPNTSEVVESNEFENDNDLEVFKPITEVNKVVSNVSADLKHVSILNMSKDVNDISSTNTSKDIKGVSTPEIAKIAKVVLTPNITTEPIKDLSTSKTPKPIQELSTLKTAKSVKEVSSQFALNHDNEVFNSKVPSAANEILSPNESEKVQSLVIPKTSQDASEASSTKMLSDFNDVLPAKLSDNDGIDVTNMEQPNNLRENLPNVSTQKLSQNVKVTTSNILNEGKDLVPNQSKDNNSLTVKKTSKCDITDKRGKVRKSRIEKELAIDMVEGHPYLRTQTEKRLTRKALESVNVGRRKSVTQKFNKPNTEDMSISSSKNDKKTKEKLKKKCSSTSVVVDDSQNKYSEPIEQLSFSDDLPCSDVIESSQDSTITTISIKSAKKSKHIPCVHVEKTTPILNKSADINNSLSILECPKVREDQSSAVDQESNEDIALPLNKTLLDKIDRYDSMLAGKHQEDLTENMDTEPFEDKNISKDVILVSEKIPVIRLVREDTIVGPDSQEIAEADTQPTDSEAVILDPIPDKSESSIVKDSRVPKIENEKESTKSKSVDVNNTAGDDTETLYDSTCVYIEQSGGASSPFKDEAQRQQDFLNNTTEISPIKVMSPNRDRISPSPETSNDYMVIKFTSPVNSNGEPIDKCSPEVFTEDKTSPDKRDLSPPREETNLSSTSPSSSLSLKKNRPQVRSGGRAAQMLGLCVSDKIQPRLNSEKNECDEVKKGSSTPARRNLRILYNSVNDNTENSGTNENNEGDNFLKFKRTLPTIDSSPAGSILKRKLAEITDDTTASPASKRKRVSFHDPPVSTTVSVQKYIEPGGSRSPQNSAQKRLERQLRQHTPLNSQKRLDNVFKLHTALTKTVESFSDDEVLNVADDTQTFSLDETPVVEIVRASELNDTDPICPELIDCKDSIEVIAGELSSSAMKSLFIKELEGKVDTIGDLAMMTELEVNRLCIKAPKVKVTRKALSNYAANRNILVPVEAAALVDEVSVVEPVTEALVLWGNAEVQTDNIELMDTGFQTMEISTSMSSSQTEVVTSANISVQTEESGCKSTAAIIRSCLSEKPDFVEQLCDQLDESTIKQMSETLPLNSVTDLLLKRMAPSDMETVFNGILESKTSNNKNKELLYIKNYLCDRFASKDLILFCSQLLKTVSEKPA